MTRADVMTGSPSVKKFRTRLLGWYRKNARKNLPWRATRDPYAIWISEAMLQQTQVAKVIPYFQRFLSKFPTVDSLAAAAPTHVFDAWAGLGYYSRARNLHAAARMICREHGGRVPGTVEELLRLPGIGRYTAGAVASIAYNQPAPILDGNVIRVLCRHFGIAENPKTGAVQKKLWALAQTLVPSSSPGDFNQALMECGALLCTPVSPRCPLCPLKSSCAAFRRNLQDRIPLKSAAQRRAPVRYACGILEKEGRLLLARRPLNGLLAGLWEFPGGEIKDGEPLLHGLKHHLKERLGIEAQPQEKAATVKQLLSHRELTISAYRSRWSGKLAVRYYTEYRWVPPDEIKTMGLTAGMLNLANRLQPQEVHIP
ncbi:MAG: A/G-specific adenine glycosylase [Candidatus Omnitrophica bacterium]|nr:A/G-specific adenine glycosylase [Candidatus Omnitrophota bacterium]